MIWQFFFYDKLFLNKSKEMVSNSGLSGSMNESFALHPPTNKIENIKITFINKSNIRLV